MPVCHLNLSQLFKPAAAQSLGCGGPCCAAPCPRVRRRWVGAAVCDSWSGTCGASRVALLTVRRNKRGSPSKAEERTVINHPALCVEPAMARVLAPLGGLDSSGVACGEEGEDEYRTKNNHKHAQPAGRSELVSTLEAIQLA